MTGLPRFTLLVVSALLLMGCVGTNTKPVSDSGRTIDLCSHVTGVWSGSHGDAITGTYSEYQAHHKRNGELEIFFTFVKPGGEKDTDHYTGEWGCSNNVLRTVTTDKYQVTEGYEYKLIEANPVYMKYQNFQGAKLGPIFEADKIGEL